MTYKKIRRWVRNLYFYLRYEYRKAIKPKRNYGTPEERRAFLLDICRNKIQYRNRKEAWKSALHFKEKYGTKTGVYKCWMCHRFHLSKKQSMNIPGNIKNKI